MSYKNVDLFQTPQLMQRVPRGPLTSEMKMMMNQAPWVMSHLPQCTPTSMIIDTDPHQRIPRYVNGLFLECILFIAIFISLFSNVFVDLPLQYFITYSVFAQL